MTFRTISSLLRLDNWIKNTFVFLPIFFAGRINKLFSAELLILFVSFCIAASAIYILNDILDAESDRQHPVKKNRPIANGIIKVKFAWITFAFLVVALSFLCIILKNSRLYVIGYFGLNVLYAFILKNYTIVDVTCISIGFVLRVMAGGEATDTFVSHWMIILVFLLTISMAFAKRRDELITEEDNGVTRKSTDGYSIAFLDIAKSISFSITLISYILYSISHETIQRIGSDKLYITSIFVFLGIMRYLQITITHKKSGSPVEVLLKDRFMQINLLLWIISFIVIIYGKNL